MLARYVLLPDVQRILADMGDSKITNITIVREPLSAVLLALLNTLSLGEFKQKLRELPFDEFFHLLVNSFSTNES